MSSVINKLRMENVTRREKWIDFGRAIAIIAVVLNHAYGRLYTGVVVEYLTYFNVSLFIYLMGTTQFLSLERNQGPVWKKMLRSIWKIIVPYVVCSFIYDAVQNQGFDLIRILRKVCHFDASQPLYYVLLYIQLLIISPIIYNWVRTRNPVRMMVGMCVVVAFSVISYKRSVLFEVYGGAKYLFGSTYLIELYIGMLFATIYPVMDRYFKTWISRVMVLLLCLSGLFISGMMVAGSGSIFVEMQPSWPTINPPGAVLIVYSFFVFLSIFAWTEMAELFAVTSRLTELISRLGGHTLYIFLYHLLFFECFLPDYGSRVLNWIIDLPVLLGGPIVIEYIFRRSGEMIRSIYAGIQESEG